MRVAGLLLLYAVAIGLAAFAAVATGFVPLGVLVHPDLTLEHVADPLVVHVHAFAVAVALILGPFQFSGAQTRGRAWIAYAYLSVGVLIGALSGLTLSEFAFGDFVTRLGFAMLATCWLYTGLRGFVALHGGNAESYRRWMAYNFALTASAVTLRLWLPALVASGVAFELAYPVVAWLSWVPNLLVAAFVVRARRAPVEARS